MEMEISKLIVPTYRLKDVGNTVVDYSENLDKYGHSIDIFVIDDSSLDVSKRDFHILSEKSKNASSKNNFYYVGPKEKAHFLSLLESNLGEKGGLFRNMFRPSYGGNRNFVMVYTLGEMFASVDDDMRPHGLFFKNRAELSENELLFGSYIDKRDPENKIEKKSFDFIGSFLKVLGKTSAEIDRDSYMWGKYVLDNSMDLFTNCSKGISLENRLVLDGSAFDVPFDAKVVVAQSYRSGSADVDTVDYINDFLIDPHYVFVNDMSLRYVLHGIRPCITSQNWRFDTGVSAFDNSLGLPPYFPTDLRFEDFIFRLWLQKENLLSAHADSVQTHYRNPYMRNSLAKDFLKEEVSNYLKNKLRERVVSIHDTFVTFNNHIAVDKKEAIEILQKARKLYEKSIFRSADVIKNLEDNEHMTCEKKSNHFIGFARDLYDEFCGFEEKSFHARLQEYVSSEMDIIIKTMDVWPSVLEFSFDLKKKGSLPFVKINQV